MTAKCVLIGNSLDMTYFYLLIFLKKIIKYAFGTANFDDCTVKQEQCYIKCRNSIKANPIYIYVILLTSVE